MVSLFPSGDGEVNKAVTKAIYAFGSIDVLTSTKELWKRSSHASDMLTSECQDRSCVFSQTTTKLEIHRHWQHGSWVRWVCTLAEHGITPLSDQARHDHILRELASWGGSPRHSGRDDWAWSLAPQLLVSWVFGQGCNVLNEGSFAWHIQCLRSAITWTPSQRRWTDEWGFDWERSVQGKNIAGKVSMRSGAVALIRGLLDPKKRNLDEWTELSMIGTTEYARGWPDIVLSRTWCHRVWFQKGCVISQSSMAVLNPYCDLRSIRHWYNGTVPLPPDQI